MEFCLLDADYIVKNNEPVIRMTGVDRDGKPVMVLDRHFLPYFLVLPKNMGIKNKLQENRMVRKIEVVKKKLGLRESTFLKVYVDLPQNIQQVRDEIKDHAECFEYSTNFYKRYLIDNKIYPMDWLKVKGKDIIIKKSDNFSKIIEAQRLTKTSGGFPKLRILAFDTEFIDGRIIMVSLADNHGYREVLTYKKSRLENEKQMLQEFQDRIQKRNPDIILTYNGDRFDFDVLDKRMNELKCELNLGRTGEKMKFSRRARVTSAKLPGRIHIDLFNFVGTILSQHLQSEVLTLNEVSRELIGMGKEPLSFDDIYSLWHSGDIKKLADYCQNDSVLALKLGEFLLPQIFSLSHTSGQIPYDCSRLTYGLLVEWYLVRKAHEQDVVPPNQPHFAEIEMRRRKRPYQGGYVKEPKQGIHKGIAVFDFKSLYPSIIVTFNISPETLSSEGHKVPGLEYHFAKKPVGFIPRNLKEIIEERIKVKKKHDPESNEKQFALKILANAMYGMLAYSGARWYSRECAESAAAYGRKYIKETIKLAEKEFDVLYADTDSLFVKGKPVKNVKQFLEKTNHSLPGMLELDLQGIYKRGIFVPQRLGGYTAKKRYALLDNKGNVTVRGLETVRRDWCPLARGLQHDVIRLVLSGKEKQAVQKVKDVIKKIKTRKISMNDIAIKTQLGKSLEEYKTTGPHIAVARLLKNKGHDVHEGMILNYIITKGSGKISEKARPAADAKLADYDIDYYVNKQIIAVALRVLSVLGYKENDFISNDKTLKSFSRKSS